jgi:hypothetical protein
VGEANPQDGPNLLTGYITYIVIGAGYTHRPLRYTHRGHTSIGYRHLSKAKVYVGTFSNKLSEKVLASTSLSKM